MIRDTSDTFTSTQKTSADLQTLLSGRANAFLVVEVAGRCTGFITWGAFRAGPGYVHTAEHTILTATPGQGVGRALMQAALVQAQVSGIHVMVAAISAGNTAAIAFHQNSGFAEVGRLPQVGQKQGRWLDLVLMSKTLGTT